MNGGEREDNLDPPVPPHWFGLTRGALAAITTMVAVGIAVSLLPPLLALTLAERGVSERAIGLLVATIALASLFTTPFAARLAGRFGTANVIAAVTPLAAIIMIVVWFVPDIRLLLPLVFLYGAAIALAFTLSEYWIATATPDRRRGFVMGLYATVLSIGFAIGPAIVALAGANSIRPFLIGAVLMGLSALPALAARGVSPKLGAAARHRFAAYIFAVPTATLGVFAFAVGESSGFAFLPLWGAHLGFSLATAPLLASAMTLGNLAFQIPLGLLADRVARRPVLLACGLVGAIGMLLRLARFRQHHPARRHPVCLGRSHRRHLHGRACPPRLAFFRRRPRQCQRRARLLLRAWHADRPGRGRRRHGASADRRAAAGARSGVRGLCAHRHPAHGAKAAQPLTSATAGGISPLKGKTQGSPRWPRPQP